MLRGSPWVTFQQRVVEGNDVYSFGWGEWGQSLVGVDVETGAVPKAVVVPLAAAQFTEGTTKASLMVVDAKMIAHKKDVDTGEVFDGKVQVKSGLQAGEQVIVENGYGLPDGTQVQLAGEKKE